MCRSPKKRKIFFWKSGSYRRQKSGVDRDVGAFVKHDLTNKNHFRTASGCDVARALWSRPFVGLSHFSPNFKSQLSGRNLNSPPVGVRVNSPKYIFPLMSYKSTRTKSKPADNCDAIAIICSKLLGFAIGGRDAPSL